VTPEDAGRADSRLVDPLRALDHLVFAAPDLEEGVRTIESMFGVRMSPGGRHQGMGTRNCLLRLGPASYMEVVSVDPDQPAPEGSRWFGLDDLPAGRLVTWCAKGEDLAGLIGRGRAAGIDLGGPRPGGRERSDGSRLTWTLSDPWADRAGGVVPFFIDWGASPHPATGLASLCELQGLRLEHPDAVTVHGWLEALGLDVSVSEGDAARVIATIRTPNGILELS
jgi:hypothetical protein